MAFTLKIDPRYCGPPDVGNGGYVAGRLAAGLPDESQGVQVRLRAGTPLATELTAQADDPGSWLLRAGDDVVAQAQVAPLDDFEAPPLPDDAAIDAAVGGCRAFRTHPFPGCFVCGPDRGEGDGMRIFPGWHASHGVAVAPFVATPDLADASGHLAREFLWAALDCTGSFALLEDEALARALEPMVLGQLTVSITERPRVGERLLVAGWTTRQEGRRGWVRSVLAREGRVLARSEAIWVSIQGR